jgi:hypothetical protein
MITSGRIEPRQAEKRALVSAAKLSRIEEQVRKLNDIYERASRLQDLESRAEHIGVRFANNMKASGLESRIQTEIRRLHEEALRREAALSLEEVTGDEDVVHLMAAVGWHFDNADENSQEIISNAWNAVLDYHLRKTGIEAQGFGFEGVKDRLSPEQTIIEQLESYERLAATSDIAAEKQTKEDLRNRLAALFRAMEDARKKAEADGEDDLAPYISASVKRHEEFILSLKGDDPNLIAAKLIVALAGAIMVETEKKAAVGEAALSALRHFGLEEMYWHCYSGDGGSSPE